MLFEVVVKGLLATAKEDFSKLFSVKLDISEKMDIVHFIYKEELTSIKHQDI